MKISRSNQRKLRSRERTPSPHKVPENSNQLFVSLLGTILNTLFRDPLQNSGTVLMLTYKGDALQMAISWVPIVRAFYYTGHTHLPPINHKTQVVRWSLSLHISELKFRQSYIKRVSKQITYAGFRKAQPDTLNHKACSVPYCLILSTHGRLWNTLMNDFEPKNPCLPSKCTGGNFYVNRGPWASDVN